MFYDWTNPGLAANAAVPLVNISAQGIERYLRYREAYLIWHVSYSVLQKNFRKPRRPMNVHVWCTSLRVNHLNRCYIQVRRQYKIARTLKLDLEKWTKAFYDSFCPSSDTTLNATQTASLKLTSPVSHGREDMRTWSIENFSELHAAMNYFDMHIAVKV